MARNGSGVYSLPAGYLATTGNTATATQHNSPLEDLETDANTARPVVAGGTGATSASSARTNLAVGEAHGDGSASAPAIAFSADTNTGIFRATTDVLAFATAGSERARIDADGALCIGKTAAEGANTFLEVAGGDSGVTPGSGARAFFENNTSCKVQIAAGTTSQSGILFSDSNATDFEIEVDHNNGGETTIDCSGAIIFRPGGDTDQHLRVTSSGLGFIAFSQASYDLGSADGFGIHATSATGIFNVQVIGASADTLDVFNVYRGTGKVAAIEANGDFLSATNSYGSLSDERLKQHIADASSEWAAFNGIRFRDFEWIASGKRDVGVIAQEVQKTYPDLVGESESGFLSVNYHGLYLRAAMALQEAMARIETLERKVAMMEADNG